MYCQTKVSSPDCVLNELMLWSHISMEHPIFLKTTAELSQKKLPDAVIEKLNRINSNFQTLHQNILMLQKSVRAGSIRPAAAMTQLVTLIDRFLRLDEYVIVFYPELKQFGMEDKVWQALVDHITHEQKFMQELMTDLRSQLIR